MVKNFQRIENLTNQSLMQVQEQATLLFEMINAETDPSQLGGNDLVQQLKQSLAASQGAVMKIITNAGNDELLMFHALHINDVIFQVIEGYEGLVSGRLRRYDQAVLEKERAAEELKEQTDEAEAKRQSEEPRAMEVKTDDNILDLLDCPPSFKEPGRGSVVDGEVHGVEGISSGGNSPAQQATSGGEPALVALQPPPKHKVRRRSKGSETDDQAVVDLLDFAAANMNADGNTSQENKHQSSDSLLDVFGSSPSMPTSDQADPYQDLHIEGAPEQPALMTGFSDMLAELANTNNADASPASDPPTGATLDPFVMITPGSDPFGKPPLGEPTANVADPFSAIAKDTAPQAMQPGASFVDPFGSSSTAPATLPTPSTAADPFAPSPSSSADPFAEISGRWSAVSDPFSQQSADPFASAPRRPRSTHLLVPLRRSTHPQITWRPTRSRLRGSPRCRRHRRIRLGCP